MYRQNIIWNRPEVLILNFPGKKMTFCSSSVLPISHYFDILLFVFGTPLYCTSQRVPRTQNSNRYKGTSLIRNIPLVGPHIRTVSRALWWPWGGGVFLMSEATLQPLGLLKGARVPLLVLNTDHFAPLWIPFCVDRDRNSPKISNLHK